jgi:hypothetical protein
MRASFVRFVAVSSGKRRERPETRKPAARAGFRSTKPMGGTRHEPVTPGLSNRRECPLSSARVRSFRTVDPNRPPACRGESTRTDMECSHCSHESGLLRRLGRRRPFPNVRGCSTGGRVSAGSLNRRPVARRSPISRANGPVETCGARRRWLTGSTDRIRPRGALPRLPRGPRC